MNPTVSRRARAAFAPAALCLAALATLGFPGCPEDSTGPGSGNPNSLTMSNCWPNDDGRFWNYAAILRNIESEEFEYVPPGQPVPTITLAHAKLLLSKPITAVPGPPTEYLFSMQFLGRLTSQSGVEGQNLQETYASPATSRQAISFDRDFLERLAQVRPDLRPRLAAAGVKVPAGPGAFRPEGRGYFPPNFIHGYVWVKGAAWIGTYGDVDTMLAWKFLTSNLRPGATFSHQLVPSLASDVWLHAEVERRVAIDVPGGETVTNAIEVLYLLDYGVSEATDAMGNVVGLFRTFDYGRVIYAPGVGPVMELERRYAYAGLNITLGYVELRLDLTATGVTTMTPATRVTPRPTISAVRNP